jgi:SAM-dependent methyltransferase
MTDKRRFAPATERNREPILQLLQDVLPQSGLVLEVASGSGEHGVYFARALPGLDWQPTDPSPQARASIEAWIAAERLENLRAPLELDAASDSWPVTSADAAVCINMIHISPWEATEGLLRGAGRILRPGAPLVLYGPYRRGKRPLEPSNAAFDESLRSRDPRWGLRELDDVARVAQGNGLVLEGEVEMPANNLLVIFRKQ